MQHAVHALGILPAEILFAFDATPSRRTLLAAVMAAPSFVMPDLSTACPLEALGNTLVRFHLRHVSLLLGGREELSLFLIRDIGFILKVFDWCIPRWDENHRHVPSFELRHRFDLAVVGDFVIQTFQDVPTQFWMSHFSTSESHRALDLVPLDQELEDTLPLDVEVAGPDLWPKLHFLDDGAGLILSSFSGLDGLVVLELAIIHHPDDGRTSIGCNLNEVKSELRCEPSGFVDVLLADLGAIGRDQSNTGHADSFVDPWFCDESTSWYLAVCVQEVPTRIRAAHHAARYSGPGSPQFGGQVGSRRLLLRRMWMKA